MYHTASQCITQNHNASHCITMHHTASQCITQYHNASHCITMHHIVSHSITQYHTASHSITQHHTASQCITHYHNASHSITQYHTSSHSITQHHTVSHSITMHHTVSQCLTMHHNASQCIMQYHTASHCITLHHTASHSITQHHTASHSITMPHTASQVCFGNIVVYVLHNNVCIMALYSRQKLYSLYWIIIVGIYLYSICYCWGPNFEEDYCFSSRDGRDLNGLKLALSRTLLRRHVSYGHGREGRSFLQTRVTYYTARNSPTFQIKSDRMLLLILSGDIQPNQ